MSTFHLDRSPVIAKTITFHCQCNPPAEEVKAIYQDTFGRHFCGRKCFDKHNPVKRSA